MALGRHLVDELELADGVDTLGRWMAHHLAELMLASEQARGSTKKQAMTDVEAAILRIWLHRADLPGAAHPLKQLTPALAVLTKLHPSSNPFTRFGFRSEPGAEEHASQFFESATKLIISLLLIRHANEVERSSHGTAADEWLSADEQLIQEHIHSWLSLLLPQDKTDTTTEGSEALSPTRADWKQIAVQNIDAAEQALASLRRAVATDR